MKNLLFITMLLLAFTMQSYGQKESEIPEKVQSAFMLKFPNAKHVKWEKENESKWEAEFKMEGKEYSVNFSSIGEWIETEYEIKIADIPANIKSILDQNFTDYEIEEAEISETISGKSFEFEIEVGDQEFDVLIDKNGNLTKKIEKEENDESDED